MKKWVFMTLWVMMLGTLTGCLFQSPDNLYSLPEPPAEYENLYAQINLVLGTGAEYAAPSQGSNNQAIQLIDLDGDGVQEAVVFFNTWDEEEQLQIYVFQQIEDESYEVRSVIRGDGNAIYSIDYEQIDDNPTDLELVVSWQISSLVYNLGVYRYDSSEGVYEELVFTPYNKYITCDLDQDNRKEVFILNLNSVQGENRVDMYDFDCDGGTMLLRETAQLSRELSSITAVESHYVQGVSTPVPALFITSNLSSAAGIITDIFVWNQSRLENVTLSEESGMSDVTRRATASYPAMQDIDGDGVLEIPQLWPFYTYPKEGSETYYSTYWQQFSWDGSVDVVFNSYYNEGEGWYLILPEEWGGYLTMTRSSSISGERSTTFYYWDGTEENGDPQAFLTVYKLTGPNRETRSRMGNRFILVRDGDSTIYAAELKETEWDAGLTEEDVMELFSLISTTWS